MRTSVNTEERLTFEDVACYLARCNQPLMAAAVRQWQTEASDIGRKYQHLLMEVTRLQTLIRPEPPTSERVSYKSEWD